MAKTLMNVSFRLSTLTALEVSFVSTKQPTATTSS